MVRIFIGWLLGMMVVPVVALLRWWSSEQANADATAVSFAVAYVWPTFMFVGVVGFYLARVKNQAVRAVLFLACGAIAGTIAAIGAPLVFPQIRGSELGILGHLVIDGTFCFAVYWYVAIGRDIRLQSQRA